MFFKKKIKKIVEKKLNICMTATKFPIMGLASEQGFLWPLARGLVQEGHRVTVIAAHSPLGKSEVLRDGVRVFYLNEGFPNYSHMKFEEAVYEKFSSLHLNDKFDLVHSIDRSAQKIGKNKKQLKVKVTYDVDATQMAQIFSILGMSQETISSMITTAIVLVYKFLTTYFGGDRELLSSADGVFVTSPQQKFFLERYYLYPEYHTYLVPYGIEIGDLSLKSDLIDLKKTLGLPDSCNVVMTVSDMTQTQEVFNILKAFEMVAIKKTSPYLIIIGKGPKWQDIEYQVYNLALGSRVKLTGALKPEDISICIAISDAYVNLSSRLTGFEPTMIEAMSQKKIIIGSELGPMANIIEDGIDGFLIRPADIQSLSHLLIEIFSGTLPIKEIGNKAHEKVMNLFDTKKMIRSLEASYQKIINND